MKNAVQYYTLALAGFLTFAVFTSYSLNTSDETSSTNNDTGLPQMVKSPKLKAAYDFAGDALPMDNSDVRERLDKELTVNSYYHSSTTLNLKKANKYFPVIEPILEKNGVPDDMKYLAVAESNLSNATSPAGAKGFWQFMKGTGAEYGLEINSEVDERYHLEKATEAACTYLKKLHKRYGKWSLVAAAYNMGGGRLNKNMKEQRADNYFDLNLNEETSRYLFRLVAIKEVMKNPTAFGFHLEAEDLWQPLGEYYEVEEKGAIENLGDYAKKYGTSYRMLKVYNPWLKQGKLSNRAKKTYVLKVPKK